MIRVLHIHTLPIVSGSGINTFLSMHGMDKDLYDVELACAPGGRLVDLVHQHHMKVRLIRGLVQPLDPVNDLLALYGLLRLLKKRSYHIVHTHNSKAGFVGRLAAKLAMVPVVVHTVHGFAFHGQEPWLRQALFKNLERLASHWCDSMIFISQPLIDWALREGIVNQGKVRKIYSGIELKQFRPVVADQKRRIREKWGIDENEAVVGIVSKLWEGKGHETLIEAFAEIRKKKKHARLIIVGEGYLYDKLIDIVRGLGLENAVLFTGFQMDVSEIIATFDVAVLPSFFEGMGRVLLEAMAMEKPVVASKVGGIPDIVEDGVDGVLVKPGKAHELAAAIDRILSDKNLAESLGVAGRNKIKEQFSAQHMVESIEALYRDLLGRKGIRLEA